VPLGIEPRGDGGAEVPLPGVEMMGAEPRSVVVAVMMPALVLLGVEPSFVRTAGGSWS
jgi:hypothetical protein